MTERQEPAGLSEDRDRRQRIGLTGPQARHLADERTIQAFETANATCARRTDPAAPLADREGR
ncbi:hypothetical protein FF100_33595 [Methylobacterium terricola]|uniref:Uncharacterized protein n=1 Tax=Methylobacterium terricola TaxID=2583531 RepID=A0A5C4L739_9HYPH|nr:hypothetical protein [Methylobacterium terricola]TNC07108.1 hypothetical protein FF100_33595 [Methylobacterium terricola]